MGRPSTLSDRVRNGQNANTTNDTLDDTTRYALGGSFVGAKRARDLINVSKSPNQIYTIQYNNLYANFEVSTAIDVQKAKQMSEKKINKQINK